MKLAWGVLNNLGFREKLLGHLDTTEQIYLKSQAFFRELGCRRCLSTTLIRLAALDVQPVNRTSALAYVTEAMDWSRRLGLAQELVQAKNICRRLSGADS